MKENMPKVIALIILITIINCSALVYKGYQSKKDAEIREENRIQKEKNKKEQFAMYIKNEEGSYDKYDGKEFPDGYKVNLEKSSCEDANGNIVSGSISTTNGKPTVTSNKTIYCTFYMDEKTLIENIVDQPETTEGGAALTEVAEDELAVRYYGTNPPNYICFGTTNKSTCTGDQDKYMYRIIGVTKDKGQGSMFKVIKKEALNTAYRWHSSYTTNTTWAQSELKANLNGSIFLTNSAYMPDGWAEKIETMNWRYADIYDATPNNATNVTAAQMVQKEQNASLPTVSAKIGLMYLADYYFAYQKSGLNCSGDSGSQYSTCKTSWMHISNNDSAPPHSYEWTMSRYGYASSGYYNAWRVRSGGSVGGTGLNGAYSVRPVFYLKSNIAINGTGTQTDPYIIVS